MGHRRPIVAVLSGVPQLAIADSDEPAAHKVVANFAAAPLYFVRSGDININEQKFKYIGQDSYLWSSLAYSTLGGARTLGINGDANIDPSYVVSTYLGFPLRCLAS